MSKEELKDEGLKKETESEEEQDAKETERPEDKPVEPSQFQKYRKAYIKQQLKEMNVKEGAEVEVAMEFINERADETDSNLDEVFRELKQRMRLDERKGTSYADPSAGNTLRRRPKPIDGREYGRQAFQRLTERGLIR